MTSQLYCRRELRLWTCKREILKFWSNKANRPAALVRNAGAVAFCFGTFHSGFAQESLRLSMTGEEAAAARRYAAATVGYYNLKWQDTEWRFNGELGIGGTDNVQATGGFGATGGDLFFQPQLITAMRWPLTMKNTLSFTAGTGYTEYTLHPKLSRYYLTPGSELAFDLNVGNILIDFHERPAIQQNAVQDPSYTGGNYLRFQNTTGVQATWDMNRLTLRCGYDHVTYTSLDTGSLYPDGQTESFFLSAGYSPKAGRTFGLEGGISLLSYQYPKMGLGTPTGGTQINEGGFWTDQLTDHFQVQAHVGYTTFSPEVFGVTTGLPDSGSLYLSLVLTHQLNEKLKHSLTVSRMVTLALYGGNYEIESIGWSPNWNLLRNISVTTPIQFQRWAPVSNSSTSGSGSYNLFSAGATFSRALGPRFNSSLAYQFYSRETSTARYSYLANTLTLSFSYRF